MKLARFNEVLKTLRASDKKYMKGGTLEELKEVVKNKKFGYSLQSMNDAMESKGKRAIKFIETLQEKGIPLEQINTTDWSSNSIRVFVTIPYGKKGGGKNKEFNRFSEQEVNAAIKFWEENTKK